MSSLAPARPADPPALETERPVAELVPQAAAGDRAAEEALCRRFVPAIRAFARRRLRSDDAVAEFTQDVLLVLVEALRAGAVAEPARVGGFVLGICRNLAHDRARMRERREALWERFGATVSAVESAEAPERDRHLIAHLEDCLSQLSARAREVVRQAYVEGASNGDIAGRLSTSEGNVRVLRHRAVSMLRDCMSKRISWEAAS
jgi:RNA polymerase sigma-70 factor (ECF subfamily)